MSNDPKDGNAPSSSPPSSEQGSSLEQQQGRWLESAIDRVAQSIDGSTTAQNAIRDMVKAAFDRCFLLIAEATAREKATAHREQRYERRIADLQVALGGYVTDLRNILTVVTSSGPPTAASKKAIEGLEQATDRFNAHMKDVTEQIRLQREEEASHASPSWLRKWGIRFADFAWPHGVRFGRMAVVHWIKLAAGGTTAAALIEVIRVYLSHGGK